jgi:hypothetical protein
MKTCENCNSQHDGSIGSGRFCSLTCSRSFSTKHKRTEINKKVSLKLTLEKPVKICSICNSEFKTKNEYCSRSCANISQIGKPKNGNYSNNGGLRDGGGRAKTFLYVNCDNESMQLNKEEILVAKILDECELKWNRNWNGFEYYDKDNNLKKFYPDFYIKDFNLYLEYKGWITDKMRHKMSESIKHNDLNLLIVIGNDKRYVNDGLSINELKTHIHRLQSG